MPFAKGRKKTGGRTKGGSFKTSKKFIDQLQRYGLNVARELAHGVMAIQDPIVRFNEIRRILPYLLPELKPIELKELEEDDNNPEVPVTDAELLESLDNGKPDESAKPSPNDSSTLEEGDSPLQAETDPAGVISGVVGEQEPE